jgi:hypothetical protein
MAFDLSNYMTAEQRIELFAAEHTDFRYEVNHEFVKDSNGDMWVVVKTILWRNSTDTHAWVMGLAAENMKTQFAVEKAETSSMARSITNTGKPQFSTTKNGEKAPRANRAEMEKVVEKPKVIYGTPNSRSAAVEQSLRSSFDEQVKAAINPEPVVWAVGEVVDAIGSSIPNEPPVCCEAGHTLKEGISKANKPYYGYVCKGNIKEHASWAVLTANGKWYFKGLEGE